MTVEQKAKRYDEALERTRALNNGEDVDVEAGTTTCEYIFPELAETEDEKIRKKLISFVENWDKGGIVSKYTSNANDIKQILTWLEKQGEQKPQGKSALEAIKEEKVDNANKVEPKDYSSIDPHFFKTTDKVEPKFKVGDWVVDNQGRVNQVTSVTDDGYGFALYDGTYVSGCWKDYYHLWTIKDAKDGDILIYNDSIFIFDEIYENDLIYYGIYEHNKFHNDKYYSFLDLNTININNIYPATKEQRGLLFQKMKEVGYEWDEKKKELKIIDWNKHIKYEPNCPSIIEENTEWSEDEKIRKALISILKSDFEDDTTIFGISVGEIIDWLEKQKSKILLKQKPIDYNEELKKCRENPLYFFDKYLKLKIKKQKPAWSEEDEKMVNDIIAAIDALHYHGMAKWLKSLKQRMNNV